MKRRKPSSTVTRMNSRRNRTGNRKDSKLESVAETATVRLDGVAWVDAGDCRNRIRGKRNEDMLSSVESDSMRSILILLFIALVLLFFSLTSCAQPNLAHRTARDIFRESERQQSDPAYIRERDLMDRTATR